MTARANILARPFLAINRQLLELESCSKHLRIQQVLESKLKKKIFHFGFEGLNSSLPQSTAESWLAKVCPKKANYAFSETF